MPRPRFPCYCLFGRGLFARENSAQGRSWGPTPVKKFKNRKSAVSRIWKAIQSLDGGSAAETAPAAPKQRKKAKAGGKPAKKAKPAAARDGSKKADVLALLQRKGGATLSQIMKAAGWQAHNVRGFIPTAGKKHGIEIESSKNEAGDRVYKIVK